MINYGHEIVKNWVWDEINAWNCSPIIGSTITIIMVNGNYYYVLIDHDFTMTGLILMLLILKHPKNFYIGNQVSCDCTLQKDHAVKQWFWFLNCTDDNSNEKHSYTLYDGIFTRLHISYTAIFDKTTQITAILLGDNDFLFKFKLNH